MIIFSKEFDCTSFPHCPYSLKEVLNYAFFTAMNTQAVFNLWESVEKTSDFWMILSNEQRAVLGSAKEVLRLSKGESVFRQGEEAQQLFYIKSGTVTESRTGGAGKPQILWAKEKSLAMVLRCLTKPMFFRLKLSKTVRFGHYRSIVCGICFCILPTSPAMCCTVWPANSVRPIAG